MLLLITCTLATTRYATTLTIANVALPQIQGALSASPDQVARVVTSNLVATAVTIPLAGIAFWTTLLVYPLIALIAWPPQGHRARR